MSLYHYNYIQSCREAYEWPRRLVGLLIINIIYSRAGRLVSLLVVYSSASRLVSGQGGL